MTEDYNHTGVDVIDDRIEEQERKTGRLKTLKGMLNDTRENTYVYVEARPDSATIHVILKSAVVTNTMRSLARMDPHFKTTKSNPDRVEYDIEEEQYILEKNFRTDR